MKPAAFEYFAPASLEEAVSLLQRHAGDGAKVLAGGQSLLPLMNFRLARPGCLVDINALSQLDYIKEEAGTIRIGAMTRERTIERSELLKQRCPILVEATRFVGHAAIRNRGTIGGCLAHNDPAGEYPLLALLLDAQVSAHGPSGERVAPVRELLDGYLATTLQPDEILTEVRLPAPEAGARWSFQEFSRRPGDFAIVAVAALLSVDDDGRAGKAALAVSGLGPTAIRAREAEAALAGQAPTGEVIERAGELVSQAGEPEGDAQASAAYRRHLAGVLTRRALTEALRRAA